MLTIDNIKLCGTGARHMHLKSNSQTMLFVPGALQDIESIKQLNAGFSSNFNYHIVELPGSGHAGPLHSSYPVSFLSECLAEYVETFIKGPCHLVSCSYATGIAIEYAKKNSQRIQTLTLAGAMQEIPQASWQIVLGLMADSLRSPQKFASDFVELLTASDRPIPKLETIKKATLRKTRKYTHSEFWTFIYNTIRLMSYRATDLDQITCPTLCFTGEYDPFVTPEKCKALADNIPNAMFSLIPDTDHLFHIERHDLTIDLITSFIQNRARLAA
ncbi:pimeloyl-ACP methyl ester carboxylesterase [Alteromonadaceae bacterium 2753L.S.0a.02]|nr:pimeloyl-ACP methyl ester carboxylesterase [Alteromonadaceae bacterium 2753L.S.0a.02]